MQNARKVKRAAYGLLISGSEVRALHGSPDFLSKSCHSAEVGKFAPTYHSHVFAIPATPYSPRRKS